MEFGFGAIISLLTLFFIYKRYHSPSDTFLRINSVRISKINKSEIEVYNCGPGSASEIKIKNKNITIINSTKKIRGYFRGWKKVKLLNASGIDFLRPEESSFFIFEGLFSWKFPIIIKWKSTKNRTQKSYWKIINGYNIRIVRTNFFVNYFYNILILLKNVISLLKKEKVFLDNISSEKADNLQALKMNQKSTLNEEALIDKAAKIITKDIFEYLKEFAKATTKNELEIALPYLVSSINIEDYVKRITKQEITIIKHKAVDEVKKTLNKLGHSYKSTAHWPLVQNYERTKEGQIYFAITGDENKVFINAEGLELLNSYLAAFRKKTFQS